MTELIEISALCEGVSELLVIIFERPQTVWDVSEGLGKKNVTIVSFK